MSKFLISTVPATGHVNPMIPLATELVRRGHDVVWHTGDDFQVKVESTGATFAPYRKTPDLRQLPLEPDPGTKGMKAGMSVVRRLLVDRTAGQYADYLDILGSFPADLVVTDMCNQGAQALHDGTGLRYATLGINPLSTEDPEIPPFTSSKPPATTAMGRLSNRITHRMSRWFMGRITQPLNATRRELGLEPVGNLMDVQRSPFLHLMPTTLAFEYPRPNLDPAIRFVGPLIPPTPPGFQPPAWWGEMDGRKVVHVTQGTYATDQANLITPALQALDGQDALLVVTTPDPSALGTVPANVRVERFIPHAELLPHVDVMITNAGYNGVLTALAHGVPLIAAGTSEDKAGVSGRIAWSGAGINLATDTPTPDRIREAVATILTNPTYAAAARTIQADFAHHNSPAEAADHLETLIR